MTTLREAAQQAITLICSARLCEINSMSSRQEMLRLMIEATDTLRAALTEPPTNQCGETCERAKLCAVCARGLADGDNLSPTEPVAWYHVPHPGNGISPVVSMFQQHEPSLYAMAVPLFIREQL